MAVPEMLWLAMTHPTAESIAKELYAEWEYDLPCGIPHDDDCGGDACLIARWARSLGAVWEEAAKIAENMYARAHPGGQDYVQAADEIAAELRARVVTP